MKSLFFFISCMSVFYVLDVSSVRKDYKEGILSKEKINVLFDKLQEVNKTDKAVLIAYKGAVTALKAKYTKGIKNKKELFKEGVSLVELAIEKKPNNIESRFIRLTIQQNTPAFLKYNTQKEVDKAFVLKNFKKIKSSILKKFIRDYIVPSKFFSKEEKLLVAK